MFDGLKRLAARFIYKSVSYSIRNAYESGATGRRLSRWMPAAHGPNAAVLNNLETIRNRARDQVRNNPWISRGIKSWEANEIGCGITVKSAAPDEEFRKAPTSSGTGKSSTSTPTAFMISTACSV